jgi:predicted RecB family nuclease
MADLDQVKGINSHHIRPLQEYGISTPEALAMIPSSIVASIDGLGKKLQKS